MTNTVKILSCQCIKGAVSTVSSDAVKKLLIFLLFNHSSFVIYCIILSQKLDGHSILIHRHQISTRIGGKKKSFLY